MLHIVRYTVIEALIPVTNMVITLVRERSDIVSLHRQMLEHLKQGNTIELKARMDELLDYLLQTFEQASASST